MDMEKESVMMWVVLLLLIALAAWGAWSAITTDHKRFTMRGEKLLDCTMTERQGVTKEAIEKAASETTAIGLPCFGNLFRTVLRSVQRF
jgi:hypothetical protein